MTASAASADVALSIADSAASLNKNDILIQGFISINASRSDRQAYECKRVVKWAPDWRRSEMEPHSHWNRTVCKLTRPWASPAASNAGCIAQRCRWSALRLCLQLQMG